MSQPKITLIKFVKAVESAYRVGVLLNKKVDGISFETKQKKYEGNDYLEIIATTDKYGMTAMISTFGIHKGTDGIIYVNDMRCDSNINERIIIRKQGISFTDKQVSELRLLGYDSGIGFIGDVTHMKIMRGIFSDDQVRDMGE
jgi:hypothetical protein